jgi:hypothetical protein
MKASCCCHPDIMPLNITFVCLTNLDCITDAVMQRKTREKIIISCNVEKRNACGRTKNKNKNKGSSQNSNCFSLDLNRVYPKQKPDTPVRSQSGYKIFVSIHTKDCWLSSALVLPPHIAERTHLDSTMNDSPNICGRIYPSTHRDHTARLSFE